MKQFTLTKVTKMGDYDSKYGQRFWAEVNEQLEPVMFNSQNQDISVGDTITAEDVLLKTSAKGTEYHGLKKVKVVEGSTNSTQSPISESKIEQILELVKENNDMLTRLTQPDIPRFDDEEIPT